MTKLFYLLSAIVTVAAVGSTSLASPTPAQDGAAIREIEVIVDGQYKPNRIELEQGERARLTFLRKDHSPCTREVVFPSLEIRRELPIEKRVGIDLPPLPPGETEFRCGMNMLRGTLIVHPK